VLIRDATAGDWPLIWPFLHQIVAAADTFTYDLGLGRDDARAMWMVYANRRNPCAGRGRRICRDHARRRTRGKAGPDRTAFIGGLRSLAARGYLVGRISIADDFEFTEAELQDILSEPT